VYLTRVWSKEAVFGTEMAEVSLEADSLIATGVAIAVEERPAGGEPASPPVSPYRLDYYLDAGQVAADAYVTRRVIVRTRGDGWRRSLDLARSPDGVWSAETESEGDLDAPPPGGDLAAVSGALDCDLGLSPLTNTMPVLRHTLHDGGGSADVLTAWISVPDLAVFPSAQRYTFASARPGRRVVRFDSLDPDTPFTADIVLDDDGVVLEYPGIAHRVA
jgi:hypothetical protein